jgi:hypothetical protein
MISKLFILFSFGTTFGAQPIPSNNNPVVRLDSEVNHSPVVRLDMDDDRREEMPVVDDQIFFQVKNLNNEKRVISKYVEVTTKIIYTFDDGSTKEVVEKNNHTFSG